MDKKDSTKEVMSEASSEVSRAAADPTKSDVVPSEKKDKGVDGAKGKKNDQNDTLKSTVLISALIMAVAGAVFAVTKKLRERNH